MADMTLERAEMMLSKLRRSSFNRGLTDIEIVRKMETTHSNGSFVLWFTSLLFIRFGTFREWDLSVMLAYTLGFIGFGAYMYMQGSRFAKIRKLFENQGPQNLSDLTVSSTHVSP